MLEQIRAIIAEEAFIPEEMITQNGRLFDLGVDSLATFQIWTRVGQDLGIQLPDGDSPFWKSHQARTLDDYVRIAELIRRSP